LSPGARKALSDARVGWVDETGAAEIAIGSIVVSRTGRSLETPERSERWTTTTIAIAEALLCDTAATVSETQAATRLSTGSCTNGLRTLTTLGLLEATAKRGRDSARRVVDSNLLLEAYAAAVEAQPQKVGLQVGVIWRDPVEGLSQLGKHWDNVKLDWAATGVAAASVVAPHLSVVSSVEAYIATNTILGLESAAADAGLRAIDSGRLTLRPFPTVTARKLAYSANGLRVVPWPRIYVDLRTSGVRGEEAAEHLREVIGGR